MRIAVLTNYDTVACFIDNDAPAALHCYDDYLHTYLEGAANTFTFSCNANDEGTQFLREGNKIAFRYKEKDYYLNIVETEQDEEKITVTAYAGSLELIYENCNAYKGTSLSFAQYLAAFDKAGIIELGLNEVSNARISNEWTGDETLLARLFSLANVFSAEIELVPVLNRDHSLNTIRLNVYKEHSDTCQGIGKNRTDVVLRYGKNISGVKRTRSIADLYTAIQPKGKNDMSLKGWQDRQVTDADGKVIYELRKSDGIIYAVRAAQTFPSNMSSNDRYILKQYSYDTDNKEMLYGQALAELKQYSVPQVSYEVEGFIDSDLGDTFTIVDEAFNPPLYLSARVTEQEISFSDQNKNKTTFDNYIERRSLLSESITQKVQQMVEEAAAYTLTIDSAAGTTMTDGAIATTLTARVFRNGSELTDEDISNLGLVIRWFKNGTSHSTGKSITVSESTKTATFTATLEDVNG